MRDSTDPCLIGVDGGGTSCRIALVTGGRRLERALGPANVSSDLDAATGTVRGGIAALAAEAGLGPEDLARARIFVGLAGVTGSDMEAAVRARLGAGAIAVADDRPAAVAGALGARDGTVASVGTGSFVARRQDGAVAGIGGWGWRLGDEASGYWLGRGMLAAALHAEDGLEAHTALTRALLAEMGGAAGLVARTLAAAAPEIAALAPRAVEAARAGDGHAVRLMEEGAAYLTRAVRHLGWTPGEPLCLLGGVGPAYREWLPDALAAAVVPPAGTALDGALALAKDLAR